MTRKVWNKEKIEKFERYRNVITILMITSVVLMFFIPHLVFVLIFLAVLKKQIKKQKVQREVLDQENELRQQGYIKICNDFFVNEEEHKLHILDTIYGFSQIIDCELVKDESSILQTLGETRIKNVKKPETKFITTQLNRCVNIAVNITTDNFNHPRIVFDCTNAKKIQKNTKA